jgi:hypothetical protein
MQLWHLNIASRTRHALFPSEALRLQAVTKLVSICGNTMVLFCIVDDHLHWVVLCDRCQCSTIARAAKLAVAALTSTATKSVHIEPVNGRNHLETLRSYILLQTIRHGLPGHPALWSGSCFPDLVGARWIPELRLRLQDVLPRCTQADLCRDLALPLRQLEPSELTELRTGGASSLVAAAAAACGATPELRGKRRETVRARRVACSLARAVDMPLREVAWALGIHPGNARKLLTTPVEPEALLATRRRITLEQVVAKHPFPRDTPNKPTGSAPRTRDRTR